jgi:hypothetical protein
VSDPAGAGAAVLKVGVTLMERHVPHGLALFRAWWRGKTILIVGQQRAGKTTFVDYLRYGVFGDEKDTEKTLEVERSPRFTVTLGRDKALELSVRTVVDVPGQVGPIEHANLAFQERPHAIILFTDLTAPFTGPEEKASSAWLTAFCKRLEAK